MNGALTTETEIHIEWLHLDTQEELGGATCQVVSYNVDWDKGTNGVEWEEAVGIETILTANEYIHLTEIESGNYY